MAEEKNKRVSGKMDALGDYIFQLEQENEKLSDEIEDLKDENNALQFEIDELKARD